MPLLGHPFTILESVDSTNNYAMAQINAGLARHGHTYFSYTQTSGKGQRGKTWSTETGKNMTLSIVIQPITLGLSEQFSLVMALCLGCYDLVKSLAGEDTAIKWPNDIYWRDRKAGGILIENIVRSDCWLYAVAGIGININQTDFNENLLNPVSIKQITGKDNDILQTAAQLCKLVQKRYDQLSNKAWLLDAYNEVLYKRNASVKFRQGNIVFDTLIKGVSSQGRLITKNTVEQEFDWGEVEWML